MHTPYAERLNDASFYAHYLRLPSTDLSGLDGFAHGLPRWFLEDLEILEDLCLAVLHLPFATKSEPCECTRHCGASTLRSKVTFFTFCCDFS